MHLFEDDQLTRSKSVASFLFFIKIHDAIIRPDQGSSNLLLSAAPSNTHEGWSCKNALSTHSPLATFTMGVINSWRNPSIFSSDGQ